MFRVVSIDSTGRGYELSQRIDGLQFSNVKNGGDETATFTFHAPWRAANPEVAEGNDLIIFDGLDVLWQGEIDEADRSADNHETLAITAYGKGAALKRDTFTEVWVDRDLNNWRDMSMVFKDALIGFNLMPKGTWTVNADDTAPGIRLAISDAWVSPYLPFAAVWYDAGVDNEVASVYDEFSGDSNTSFQLQWQSSVNDSGYNEQSADLYTATSGAGTRVPSTPRRFFGYYWVYNTTPGGFAGAEYFCNLKNLAVFGNHGLTKQGAAPNEGFFASQIIANLVARIGGITARRIDQTSVVITQRVDREPITYEDGIAGVNDYHSHERTFGTWGPNSPLEPLGVGQFDYTTIDGSTDHWTAMRADFDSLGLQSERSALFNRLIVQYTDEAGASKSVIATRFVAELGARTQTKTIDGGTLTDGAAAALAAAAIALYGGFAPARATATLSKPIRHYRRGLLPAHYMRADGSNLRVPDVLPSTTMFELSTDPDRRTTFPIERVTVDCSGPVAKTTVEMDQTHDAVSALLAREALVTQRVAA